MQEEIDNKEHSFGESPGAEDFPSGAVLLRMSSKSIQHLCQRMDKRHVQAPLP